MGLGTIRDWLDLLEWGKASVEEVGEGVAAQLTGLSAAELRELDQTLRHRPLVTPQTVGEWARRPHAWAWLALASMAANGWVRAAAVEELAKLSAHELPFLILRSHDWVPSVRQAALEALEARLVTWRASELVAALPQLVGLGRRAEKERARLLERIGVLLADPACRAAVQEGLASPDRRVRRACLTLGNHDPTIRAAGFRDPDPVLRARTLEQATSADLDGVRSLLADPTGSLRSRAIGFLSRHRALTDDDVRAHLLDADERVRLFVQHVGKERGIDPVPVYRGAVAHPIGIRGLAETSPKACPEVAQALSHPRPAMRRAALASTHRLPGDFTETLLAALDDPSPAVARTAAAILRRSPVAGRALSTLLSDPRATVRARTVALELAVGAESKWSALGLILAHVGVIPRAASLLWAWLAAHNRRYVRLPSEQKPRLEAAVDAAPLSPEVAATLRAVLSASASP